MKIGFIGLGNVGSKLNIPELTATVQLAKDLQLNGSPMQNGAGLLHVGDRLGYFGTDFELPSYTTAGCL